MDYEEVFNLLLKRGSHKTKIPPKLYRPKAYKGNMIYLESLDENTHLYIAKEPLTRGDVGFDYEKYCNDIAEDLPLEFFTNCIGRFNSVDRNEMFQFTKINHYNMGAELADIRDEQYELTYSGSELVVYDPIDRSVVKEVPIGSTEYLKNCGCRLTLILRT